MLNSKLLKQIRWAKKRILLVTKYWDEATTKELLEEARDQFSDIIYGVWENRIEQIREKNIPREHLHFIWNIQSQKIPEIVKYCSHIHSLASLKHAQKIENQGLKIEAFIQIRLDEQKDIWISEDKLWDFLVSCRDFKNLTIIWISGMWSGESSEEEKRKEFRTLISLRNTYFPDWLISAGTSRDYEIALEEWIDIVRVGTILML